MSFQQSQPATNFRKLSTGSVSLSVRAISESIFLRPKTESTKYAVPSFRREPASAERVRVAPVEGTPLVPVCRDRHGWNQVDVAPEFAQRHAIARGPVALEELLARDLRHERERRPVL